MPGAPQKGVATLWLDSNDGWTFKKKGEKVLETIGFRGDHISIGWLQIVY